jgi:hypothetical protein
MRTQHAAAALVLTIAFLAPGIALCQANGDELDSCDELPPQSGCIEVQELVLSPGSTSVTVNQVATLEGTCDNLKDCAKAKKQCNNLVRP